ncbi:MAG: ribonuclease III [Arcobacter butzleri]|jgi:ribonuclease-3|nr:ribonuclease III [Arcobacteraceae bacterium]NLO17702.1 ribonuclease III [Aliarcobacter butzleri]
MSNIQDLTKCLGYEFNNSNLITQALTHKSYKKPYSNERLEFLGDAVLNLIVGEYLYHKFPKSSEGELSKLRATLVNEKAFTKLANKIELGKYILLSAAEERNSGREKSSILSDAFEAIMGAIYLESGIERVKTIVLTLLEECYGEVAIDDLFYDFKTALQELTQAEFAVTPDYRLEASYGPDHKKEFVVSIWINDTNYGTGKGKSKKIAQQEAAKMALKTLQK